MNLDRIGRSFNDSGIVKEFLELPGHVEVNLKAIHSGAQLTVDKRGLVELLSAVPSDMHVTINISAVHNGSKVVIH